MVLLFLLALNIVPADSTQYFYAEKNVHALEDLYNHANSRATLLMCRYRLYPLTQNEKYVDALPSDLPSGSALELALLSGLWGYRAARAPVYLAIKYGLYAERLLERAKALDASHPYVLLIEGQSLLFRPRFAGGDKRAALERFRRLHALLKTTPGNELSSLEAELWIWYTLRAMDDPAAQALRTSLLSLPLPPLYREFLSGA